MSRAPPFPTRRTRSPSLSNSSSTNPGASGTRPLQIVRPPSRPTTPSNSSYISGTSPRGLPSAPTPSRPQRSELRSRAAEQQGSDRGSTSSRDYQRESAVGLVTSLVCGLLLTLFQYQKSNTATPSNRSQPNEERYIDNGEATPTSLSTVMSAFKTAGRRRAMTNDDDDLDYQRERQSEINAEKSRQQRIRDKVPGRRTNGKPYTGDIDGV